MKFGTFLVLLLSLVNGSHAINIGNIENEIQKAINSLSNVGTEILNVPQHITNGINSVENFFNNNVKGAFNTAIGGVTSVINTVDTEVKKLDGLVSGVTTEVENFLNNEILGPLKSQVLEPAEAFADAALSKVDMVVSEATTSDP